MTEFAEVMDYERKAIEERRRKAGFTAEANDFAEQPEGCVGLALSGGGIRSAAFNLGLLQALGKLGLLRHIDYISAVSGGGYIGTYLSTFVSVGANQLDDAFTGDGGKDARRPSNAIQRLINGGMYLRHPVAFANRYLMGWLLLTLFVGSGLLALTSLAAFLFRMLDWRPVLHVLSAFGARGDISRAIVPALVFFVCWGICWFRLMISERARWGLSLATRILLGAMCISIALAIAALLGTGDIAFSQLEVGQLNSKTVDTFQQYGAVGLVFLLVTALLPYVRPRDLIRSATRPRNALEGWLFRFASYAALVGVPLFLFGILARENVSNVYGNQYDPGYGYLTLAHIGNWEAFLERVEAEAESETNAMTVSKRIWTKSEIARYRIAIDSIRDDIEGLRNIKEDAGGTVHLGHVIVALQEQKKNWLQDYQGAFWPWETAVKTVEWTIRIPSWISVSNTLDERKEAFVAHVNAECIDDPDLHKRVDMRRVAQSLRNAASDASQVYKNNIRKYVGVAGGNPTPEQRELLQDELNTLRLANWKLLKAHYGQDDKGMELIRDHRTVFAYNVTRFDNGDQGWRLIVFAGSLGIFCLAGLFVDLNKTSLHSFYRDRLASVWIYGERATDEKRTFELQQLDTTRKGYPYFILNGTLNFLKSQETDNQSVMSSFLFSQGYVGTDECGYKRTRDYWGGKFDLADAMAISGGAVTPTVFENPLLSLALFVFNFRLGQWLESPSGNGRRVNRRHPAPVPLAVACDSLRHDTRQRGWCFVSDGGHYENLGIEALIKRRCHLIIASDAGADRDGEFADLMNVMRRLQRQGYVFESIDGEGFNLNDVTPDKESGLCRSQYVVGRIRYPRSDEPRDSPSMGYFIYIKPSLKGDEDADLLQYRKTQADFPNESTLDQFFSADRFDAYRRLGGHVGEQVYEDLFDELGDCDPTKLRVAGWRPPQLKVEAHVAVPR